MTDFTHGDRGAIIGVNDALFGCAHVCLPPGKTGRGRGLRPVFSVVKRAALPSVMAGNDVCAATGLGASSASRLASCVHWNDSPSPIPDSDTANTLEWATCGRVPYFLARHIELGARDRVLLQAMRASGVRWRP
ncbi:hypothetical protein MAHJHV61_39720 [Mycobacterium avium subsp. hominissuis]